MSGQDPRGNMGQLPSGKSTAQMDKKDVKGLSREDLTWLADPENYRRYIFCNGIGEGRAYRIATRELERRDRRDMHAIRVALWRRNQARRVE